MRYRELFASDWGRILNDSVEPVGFRATGSIPSGAPQSGSFSGIVFNVRAAADDAGGGRASTATLTISASKEHLSAINWRPKEDDLLIYSGCSFVVIGVTANPATLAITGEARTNLQRSPLSARGTA